MSRDHKPELKSERKRIIQALRGALSAQNSDVGCFGMRRLAVSSPLMAGWMATWCASNLLLG